MIIPMESIKKPKRIIKKQLKNVNKAIIEIAEMKFVNIEEKEEKLEDLNRLLPSWYQFCSHTNLDKLLSAFGFLKLRSNLSLKSWNNPK